MLDFFSDLAGARTQDHLLKREVLYQLSYQVFINMTQKHGSIRLPVSGLAAANIISLCV